MFCDYKSSYREHYGNIYDSIDFNNNYNNNKNDKYINLRYANLDDDSNDNYINVNEIKNSNNSNYSSIFSKKDQFKIEKDRFQKFFLNKSSLSNYKNKQIHQPLYNSFRKTNNKFDFNHNNKYNIENEEKTNNEKNNLILSQNDIYNNQNYKHMNILDKFTLFPKYHYIYDKNNGKRRTDITNNEIVDKVLPETNKDYIDYIYKNREIDLFNKRMLARKNNLKLSERNKIILKERNLMKEKENYFKRVCLKDALYNKNKIKYYKSELDHQMDHFLENKLNNENLPYSQFLKNKDYNRLKTPIMKYLNQNDYFDVNPFNNKSLNLGKSNLKYDTLLNPKIQFKTNKYLFPEIVNKNNYSTIH